MRKQISTEQEKAKSNRAKRKIASASQMYDAAIGIQEKNTNNKNVLTDVKS